MDCNSSGSLSRITATVAPGKHRVTALKKRISLTILLPTMSAVGLHRGRGGTWGKPAALLSGAGERSAGSSE